MKLILLSITLFFLLLPLFSCSNDDSGIFDNATINTNYVVWRESDKKQKPLDIVLSNSDAPYLFTTPHGFSLESFSLSAEFMLDDCNDKTSIIFGKERAYMSLKSNKVSFWDGNFICEEEISSILEIGLTYTFKVTKNQTSVLFEILDKNTVVFDKSFSVYNNRMMALMRGKPVFMINNGDFHIINIILDTPYKQPLINVFGDSFVEGVSLMDNGINLDTRWVSLLQKSIGEENCLIDGKGGEKMSPEFINRVMYINSIYKSKYVLLSIGTNNYSDVSRCISEMKNLTEQIKKNNQIPIFATVTPRKSYDYNNTAVKINDWIKSSGELYVDMHQAVTPQDSPEWWAEGYVLSDGIHPTAIAYDAMFEQLKDDCTFLFE